MTIQEKILVYVSNDNEHISNTRQVSDYAYDSY